MGGGEAPSARPAWPGREAMAAYRRPDLNWSATCGSMVLFFLRGRTEDEVSIVARGAVRGRGIDIRIGV